MRTGRVWKGFIATTCPGRWAGAGILKPQGSDDLRGYFANSRGKQSFPLFSPAKPTILTVIVITILSVKKRVALPRS